MPSDPHDAVTLLGLESSCDETAAAVVRAPLRDGVPQGPGEILSSVVFGQADLHAAFGGVVPEIAARAHAERLDIAALRALEEAGTPLAALDAVAATAGPGLIGGVLAGVMCGKGIAMGAGLPFVGVNHLAGHALTPRLTEGLAYPYLLLLVSGGHCQILAVLGPERFRRLGTSIDDAPGEAFDKTAKLLGLGYPGGPEVERAAKTGDPDRFALPRPLLDRPGCEMSFSGLKTALRRARDRLVEAQGGITPQDRADLCAGFQAATAEVLSIKTARAMDAFATEHAADLAAAGTEAPTLAVAGGVAANTPLRAALTQACAARGWRLSAPPLALCTDNAAMIAWAGAERLLRHGPDPMDLPARPRWPLDREAAPLIGSGRKGARA
ncbi:MAG: tRNA (adenosine(37)-N6)-threonylcarbamoyltransferase complex transferase subunit TsaD [Rhodobacteraceae bacterium]|nr:tRNA (adenosine(37)-N6)-threonylcarbamoyltransferase complex transferase subunit TsaD [Paracoccaceae bacterium]